MELSDAISKFLSDPEAEKAAAELAGKMMQSANGQQSANGTEAEKQPPQGDKNGGDILSAVLDNPEFMQKMPQMLSALAPMLNGAGTSQTAQATPQSLPQAPFRDSEQAKRSALLLALKPYLSPERAETVDYIIRLTGLIELFSLLK